MEECNELIDQQIEEDSSDQNAGEESHPLQEAFLGGANWPHELTKRVAGVFDEVLLAKESVSFDTWECIVRCVKRATTAGLPMLRVYPKLVSFESPKKSRLLATLIEEIVTAINSEDDARFQYGVSALNHWANQLDDSRFPSIPRMVLRIISDKLHSGHSRKSIHVIGTVRNLLLRLPINQSKQLLGWCDPGLRKWSDALQSALQEKHREQDIEMQEEIPDLREALTRLCVVAAQRPLDSTTVQEWLDSVQKDPMCEIKRALAETEF